MPVEVGSVTASAAAVAIAASAALPPARRIDAPASLAARWLDATTPREREVTGRGAAPPQEPIKPATPVVATAPMKSRREAIASSLLRVKDGAADVPALPLRDHRGLRLPDRKGLRHERPERALLRPR